MMHLAERTWVMGGHLAVPLTSLALRPLAPDTVAWGPVRTADGVRPRSLWAAIAEGPGGRTALEALAAYVDQTPMAHDVPPWMTAGVHAAHQAVGDYPPAMEALLPTTLLWALVIGEQDVWLAHVGASQAYWVPLHGPAEPLTGDRAQGATLGQDPLTLDLAPITPVLSDPSGTLLLTSSQLHHVPLTTWPAVIHQSPGQASGIGASYVALHLTDSAVTND